METFCAPGGRAGDLGCSIASIDHCQFMQGDIWHKIYDAVKYEMEARGSALLRFVDLWTLTLQIPENCLGGHQSPMSAIWTWQILLGGFCRTPPSEGTLAVFEGDTCRAAQVNEVCKDPHSKGYHYLRECALSELCTMVPMEVPKGMEPTVITDGTVDVDLAAAASVPEAITWAAGYRMHFEGSSWLIELVVDAVAAACCIVAVFVWCSKLDKSKLKLHEYGPVANGSPGSPKPILPVATKSMGHDIEQHDASRELGVARADPVVVAVKPVVQPTKGSGGDKFSFGLARCIASLHVVAGHLYARQAIQGFYVFSWGFTWVPWFFMLSGFILFTAEARSPRNESVVEYVTRRSVSIYPLYAVGLLIAFAIAKSQSAAPHWSVLIVQALLLQAWVPCMTERTLQMQCWFLSCLVAYWACFGPLFRCVQNLRLGGALALIAALCALPWLLVVIPVLGGLDPQWYNEHNFGHAETPVDVLVVFLKFNPVCFVHVFLVGMLLGKLRILLEPYAYSRALRRAVDLLAPLGYLALGLIFFVPALRPPAAKLSARLSVLMPLQSSILFGLAGLPGVEHPPLARVFGHLNFLENYSYSVYVMQFIVYHLWPTTQVGVSFFLVLGMAAALAVHVVQKPVDKLGPAIRRHPYVVLGTPFLMAGIMLLLSILVPDPDRSPDIPAFARVDDRLVDVRLPIEAEGVASGNGAVLINPSLLFRGDEVIIAARLHRRESVQTRGDYKNRDVAVVEQTWHSEIVIGSMALNWGAWDEWLTTGKPPKVLLSQLSTWTGLRTPSGSRWAHLCSRETWIPQNQTLVKLVVTGPEDPKVFQLPSDDSIGLAFSSYPPLGRHGCGKDGAVSQMYLATGVVPSEPAKGSLGVRLQCGETTRAEKNWIPFESDGQLYFVYSILPHVVVEGQLDGMCGRKHYSNFAPLVRLQATHPGWSFRGSAQALYIDDPLATPNLPEPHFLALLHVVDPKTHRYAHFAYRFKPKPPFDILQVSSQLQLKAARSTDGGPGFAYVSSLAVRHREVVISYAAGDRDPRALILTLWRLDAFFNASRTELDGLGDDEGDRGDKGKRRRLGLKLV
jgi:peptidoglycan/LPS O-acetylase OafA/YrhL